MTRPGEPYSRIYWSVMDDYPDIYEDDAALSLWVRMLLDADAAYPMRPISPKQTKALSRLENAGLVIIERRRYTVRGLTQERDRRSERGRAGGVASGQVRRSTTVERPLNDRSEQPANESNLDETRRDETRRAETNAREASLPNDLLPEADDPVTLACRMLPDGGRWLTDREYVAAWEDLVHRFNDWVAEEIGPGYQDLLASGATRVKAWDLKRAVEWRLAERNREHDLADAEQRRAAQKALNGHGAKKMTSEQLEQSDLARRAVRLWMAGPKGDKVPEELGELRQWVEKREGAKA